MKKLIVTVAIIATLMASVGYSELEPNFFAGLGVFVEEDFVDKYGYRQETVLYRIDCLGTDDRHLHQKTVVSG